MPVVPSDMKPLHVGTDWMEQPSSTMRSKVVADDGLFGPEFIEVEAGSLPPSSWAGAQAVHTFHLAKTEVTWAQFQEVQTGRQRMGMTSGTWVPGRPEPSGYQCQLVSGAEVVQCVERERGIDPRLQD